jgi:transcriptional regulator with XRE-family HTH domain
VATPRIAEALKAARARLGWSREALAFHSGVSWSAIAQIESGRRTDVRLSSLAALATALGVGVDYLIGSVGSPPQLLEHRVLTYGSDEEFLAGAVPFVVEGVDQSQCVLVVTSPAKTELVRDALGQRADLVEFADWTEGYRSPRAALDRYRDYVSQVCARGGGWIRVLAEAGWSGHTEAEIEVWTRYESLVNLALASFPATFLCTYDEHAFPADVIAEARTTHRTIVRGSDLSASPAYREPAEFLLAAQDA